MPIVVIAEIPGGTAEQDEAMLKEMDIESDPPAGALFRAAGPIPGGWRIMSVWESQEAFDTFRRERIAPILQKLGRPLPPTQIWPVHSVRTPR